jgi:hypothetical protein
MGIYYHGDKIQICLVSLALGKGPLVVVLPELWTHIGALPPASPYLATALGALPYTKALLVVKASEIESLYYTPILPKWVYLIPTQKVSYFLCHRKIIHLTCN